MSAAGKQRTDDILKLAGRLLRAPGVRRFYLDSPIDGLLPGREYGDRALLITYIAWPAGIRPLSLTITFNDLVVFRITWDAHGHRRKVRDETGLWERLLRREVDRVAAGG